MEKVIYDMIVDFISTIGFPIFVATYLLLYIRPVMKENTEVVKELAIWLKRKNGGENPWRKG